MAQKFLFDFWFPPKQGLKRFLLTTSVLPQPNLISDFHQNKDWNHIKCDRSKNEREHLISDFHQNKDWNGLFGTFLSVNTGSFDFWFPPKQGLKLSKNGTIRPTKPDLISDFHQNKDWNDFSWLHQCYRNRIWFLISTKTRIETI